MTMEGTSAAIHMAAFKGGGVHVDIVAETVAMTKILYVIYDAITVCISLMLKVTIFCKSKVFLLAQG